MISYWSRQRLLFTLIVSVLLAFVVSQLFVYPYIEQKAANYNSQSLYKNTDVDFVVPEPSFDQVSELPGTNGIATLFPFYLTKTPVEFNGKTRTTTILVTDQRQSLEKSMYTSARLIRQSKSAVSNPVLIDWQFAHDTGAGIGDNISISIGVTKQDYQVYAIYETNTLYDGGALLIQVSDEQMESIRTTSQNSGYSGMYVAASNYDVCRTYLATEYRPLGRLRAREQFADDEQYQIHYDAIMSSGYSNEITDFRIRENELDRPVSSASVWLGALLTFVAFILFNLVMANRGSERNYFTRHCIPNGTDVKPYYLISFVAETACSIILYAAALAIRVRSSSVYIHDSTLNFQTILFPIAVIVAEIICLTVINRSIYAVGRNAVVTQKNETYQTTDAAPVIPSDADKTAGQNEEPMEIPAGGVNGNAQDNQTADTSGSIDGSLASGDKKDS